MTAPRNAAHSSTALRTGAPRLRRASHLLPLEQRFMFDGAAAADVVHAQVMADAPQSDVPIATPAIEPPPVRPVDAQLNGGRKEVVFIDTSLTDYKSLEASVREGVEIREICSAESGTSQILRWAQTHADYDAIHIVSHGSEGTMLLGGEAITAQSLSDEAMRLQWARIGSALRAEGDLLLYGCDLARGEDGRHLMDGLALATGADVSASQDATGAQVLGGNWALESQTGSTETASPFETDGLAAYNSLLATLTFDTATGSGSKVVEEINGSDVVVFTATDNNFLVDTDVAVWNGGIAGASGNVLATGDGGLAYESKVTITVLGGKVFDLSSLNLVDLAGDNRSVTITTNKGTQTFASGFVGLAWTLAPSGAMFQGISYAELTTSHVTGEFSLGFDNVVLNNITPLPTVTDPNISITSSGSGTAGIYRIGDTVTAQWNNSGIGDNNSGITGVTMNFSQFGGGTAVAAMNAGGIWTSSYTLIAGVIDGGGHTVSVTASNAGGSTTQADSTSLNVDNVAPTVTEPRVSISGASGTSGAYKIGDTLTASWNNTGGGDGNIDTIAGVTIDFSAFGGGSAVIATDSSGTWTATYTIVSGAIDATNRNVSVTATDNAGNVTTRADAANATIDSVAPTIADAHISISGGSGAGGAYKTGDTVTATWNNTGGGDNNVDTIVGATVDFSQFGGGSSVAASNSSGTWTATYTLVSGAINNGTNRNVAVTVTDDAGNTSTTADTTHATVDNLAPAITFSALALSADTGGSPSDFITSTAAQTITATLSGALGVGDVVLGSLDNGSSWTDITSKVSGTALSWNGVTLIASSTLRLKVTDAAGNDGAVASQAYTLDSSAPNVPSTPGMTNGTDSGISNSDNITNDNTPTFTGTAEADSTVTLYDTDGVTVLGTATATGGNWSITASTLTAGNHMLMARATDAAGNVSSPSSSLAVTIDTAAPTALNLSATTIATTSATSTSTISTLSSTDAAAVTYALAAGNGTNDADNGSFTISGNSLRVGGASLTAGTYHIYVAATDTAGNVANQAFTVTIVDAPSVSSIVRTGGASATVSGSAASVSYTVTFSEAVTGVEAGDFALTATGTAAGSIAGVSGSGTTYTVTVNTLSGDGTLRVDLNASGTGIQNGSGVDIASGYTAGSTYTLDHTSPNAPSAPDMTSGTDTGVSSSDNVTSNATPTFAGTAEVNSTVTLYDTDGTTVLGTATATGGNWSITASTLSSGSHTLTAKAIDAAGNTSSPSSGLSVAIDTSAPTVSSVTVPSNGSYRAGQVLNFTVNTSEAVTVNTGGGTPRLALTLGGATVYASYASGSGTSALVFSYTVQAGDTDADGIAVSALQSNGGTLRDTAGNNLTLTLNGVGATGAVLVDTAASGVTSVSVPSNGTYGANANLDFTVNFDEAVTVDTTGGTPRIALTIGSSTVYANYLSGSGTSALVFRHVVPAGSLDIDGITVGAMSANSGTLRDTAGNDATLTLNSVGSTASVLVDAIVPAVTNVSSAESNGHYRAGDSLVVTVSFDKVVNVDTTGGTPSLALDTGGVASYSGGSGTATLSFLYVVGAGENSADLDMASVNALALNGATILEAGGANQAASLTLATPGAAGSLGANKAIVIDTTPPAITFSGLAFSADTGLSATDFVTRTAAQTLTATLSATPAGSDVVYGSLDNGATWIDVTAHVTGTTLTWSGVTLTGSNTLRLWVSDTAGNDGLVLTQAYVLDGSAPGITFDGLALSSDTGTSGADFITRTAEQTLTATLSAAPAGSDRVYGSLDDGVTWTDITGKVSGTTLAWDGITLGASGTLRLRVTDLAGNDGPSPSQAYTLDTTSPTIDIAGVALSSDTGASDTDFITQTAAQTITATLTTALAAGDVVQASLDDGNTWVDITSKVSGTSLAWDGATLVGGNVLKFKVTDAAGNEGPSFSRAYVLDAATPTAPVITPITTTSLTPTLSGTATLLAGDTLAVTVDGVRYAVVPVGDAWTLDLASTAPVTGTLTLEAGHTYDVTAVITDTAGNIGTAMGTLAIDVPPAPRQAVELPTPVPPTSATPLFVPTSIAASPPASGFLSPATESPLSPVALPIALPATTAAASLPVDRGPALTQGGGDSFRIVVVPAAGGAGDVLLLNRGMVDQAVPSAGRSEITVPADAFAHSNPAAAVMLSASQANGQPLPNWIDFNPRTGKFIVQAPRGVTGELAIKVTARDAQGHEATMVFKVRVGGRGAGQAVFEPSGHAGLSDHLRSAAEWQPAEWAALRSLATVADGAEVTKWLNG